MLSIRNDIPVTTVSADERPIESFYVELNFQKKNKLLNFPNNPMHNITESHLDSLSKSIDSPSSKFNNFILLGDFNSCMKIPIKTISETYKLRNLIKVSTCFKNPENPAFIDLIFTNKPLSFKNAYVIETGLYLTFTIW